jgi:hypothetical protein
MKQNYPPLMALAMASILAPAAEATLFPETTDYSDNPSAPTNLGPFNPAVDGIMGSVLDPDQLDFMSVSATPGAAVSLPFFLQGAPTNPIFDPNMFVYLLVYDNGSYDTLITSKFFTTGATNSATLNFNVPADGNYVMLVNASEGGGFTYTIGAVPEPGTTALLAAGLVGAALHRGRKKPAKT